MMIHRRTFLTLLAAPAIVRASSLMAISPVPKPMTGSEIERLQADWEAECGRLASEEFERMVANAWYRGYDMDGVYHLEKIDPNISRAVWS